MRARIIRGGAQPSPALGGPAAQPGRLHRDRRCVGFAIGILGHLFKVRWLVGIGIALIVIGALLLPFAAGIPSNEKSPPGGEAIEGGFSE